MSQCQTQSEIPTFAERSIAMFDEGETIFEDGAVGREMFVVLSGAVEISIRSKTKQIIMRILRKGQFFGEFSAIDAKPRSATARSTESGTRLMRIDQAEFVYLVTNQPAFALMVMNVLVSRLRTRVVHPEELEYRYAASM